MKRYVLAAAVAGAMLSAAAVLPNAAGAMTITAPAGLASAATDVASIEHVWWRHWGGYWGPRPYYGGYGFYRPYGYYRPDWGWRRRW